MRIGKNVVIKPSTYTIGITDEYTRILSDARVLKEFEKHLTEYNTYAIIYLSKEIRKEIET